MTFIGQVIDKLTDNAVNVWDLDNHGGYVAYGVIADDWLPGAVTVCHVSADGRYVERMAEADAAIVAAYKDKKLIP